LARVERNTVEPTAVLEAAEQENLLVIHPCVLEDPFTDKPEHQLAGQKKLLCDNGVRSPEVKMHLGDRDQFAQKPYVMLGLDEADCLFLIPDRLSAGAEELAHLAPGPIIAKHGCGFSSWMR